MEALLRTSRIVAYVGVAAGFLAVFYAAWSYIGFEPYTTPLAIVGIGAIVYFISFLLIRSGRWLALTGVVILMVVVNILSLPSIGLLIIPATLLLVLSLLLHLTASCVSQ